MRHPLSVLAWLLAGAVVASGPPALAAPSARAVQWAAEHVYGAYDRIKASYAPPPGAAPLDMAKVGAAARKAIRDWAGGSDADWAACVEQERHGPRKLPLDPDGGAIRDALVCALDHRNDGLTGALTNGTTRAMLAQLEGPNWWTEAEGLPRGPASIGATLALREGRLVIDSVMAGGPAERAGLRPGDQLVTVEGLRASDLPQNAAAAKLTGPPGSDAVVAILRPDGSRSTQSVTRAVVDEAYLPMAQRQVGDVLVLRMRTLIQGGRELMRAAIEQRPAGTRAIVLDLRGSPGGVMPEIIAIADDFLDTGLIASQSGRKAKDITRWSAKRGELAKGMPVAVLVDADTAGGAETLAAALQDAGRARVFGRKTRGAGAVATIFSVNSGALRLTTGYLFRPNGQPMQGQGVTPDCGSDLEGDALLDLAAASASGQGGCGR